MIGELTYGRYLAEVLSEPAPDDRFSRWRRSSLLVIFNAKDGGRLQGVVLFAYGMKSAFSAEIF